MISTFEYSSTDCIEMTTRGQNFFSFWGVELKSTDGLTILCEHSHSYLGSHFYDKGRILNSLT